jgi:hypothetical protein
LSPVVVTLPPWFQRIRPPDRSVPSARWIRALQLPAADRAGRWSLRFHPEPVDDRRGPPDGGRPGRLDARKGPPYIGGPEARRTIVRRCEPWERPPARRRSIPVLLPRRTYEAQHRTRGSAGTLKAPTHPARSQPCAPLPERTSAPDVRPGACQRRPGPDVISPTRKTERMERCAFD